MSKAVILQHAPYAGPGRIIDVFGDFGIACDVRAVHRGDEIPTDLEEIRVLVVLGGPMGVGDVGSTAHSYLEKEVGLLRRMIEHDRPVLGIALGAQLLAHAAGAKVYPNTLPGATPDAPRTPAPEYGWGGVTFPFPGGTEPMVFGMIDGAPMFHWHADTFDLPRLPPPASLPPGAPPPPPGNSLLSSSRLCKNQAFRFKTRLFGFQYHFEFKPEQIEALLASEGPKVLGAEGVARVRDETKTLYARHERLGNRLLRNYVQFLKAY
jgi:GMP synthase-like glutamine amidotransferase